MDHDNSLFETIIKALRRENGRKLRRMERGLERKVKARLEKQKKSILSKSRKLFNQKDAGLEKKIDVILEVVNDAGLVDDVMAQSAISMRLGALYRIRKLKLAKVGISFDLDHPLAAQYLKKDRRVLLESVLPQTTKDQIKPILLKAIQTGQSYEETAELISSAHSLSADRAQMIAVNEIGNAYEEGNLVPMKDLQNEGYKVEKEWITVGDAQVTATHSDNESDGWIDIDKAFSGTGDDRAPGSDNPRCRCTMGYRFD